MKKLVLFVLLLVPTTTLAANYLPFAEYLGLKRIIVRQNSAENYHLESNVLRQEVVGTALRLTSLRFSDIDEIVLPDLYTCEGMFQDVSQSVPNTWACRSVEAAAARGVISSENGHFRPEDPITRAEAIAMNMGILKLANATTLEREDFDTWQGFVMAEALEMGIINEDVLESPDEYIKRGELFAYISKMIQLTYERENRYLQTLFDSTN